MCQYLLAFPGIFTVMRSDEKENLTIRDLARMLDCSIATVSRALSGQDSVKPETKKRVFDLVRELGFQGNDYARMLKSGQTHIIGCIVPKLNDHLVSSIVSGIENVAHREGYSVIMMQSQGSEDVEAKCANSLFNRCVDGLIVVLPNESGSEGPFGPFLKKKIPVVSIDGGLRDPSFLNIHIDNKRAGYTMTRHLLEQGRRRIVHVTSDLALPAYIDRLKGYEQALAEAGIPIRQEYIIKGGTSLKEGMLGAEAIFRLDRLPDAIFAATDSCAAGCMFALKARRICIPDEIAMAGFGNEPVSLVVEPHLTTVSYPGIELGEAAATQLIYRMGDMLIQQAVDTVLMRSDLIVRGSTAIH